MVHQEIFSDQRPRILVVMQAHQEMPRLFRVAKRKAELLNYDWELLVIEVPRAFARQSEFDKQMMLQQMTLAKEMGAMITQQNARDVAMKVAEIVRERIAQGIRIHSVKVALMHDSRNWLSFRPPLHDRIKHFLAGTAPLSLIPIGAAPSTKNYLADLFHLNQREVMYSLAVVAVATLVIEAISLWWPEAFGLHNRNKTMIYLLACMFSAGRYGFVAGLISSTASFFTLSVLYIAPYYSLRIDDQADAMSLALFTLAGLTVSFFGNRDYGSRLSLLRRAERYHSLLTVHRLALGKGSVPDVIAVLDEEMQKILNTEVIIYLPASHDENMLETIHRDVSLNRAEERALSVCWSEGETTGAGAPFNLDGCRYRFEPMTTAADEIGVLAVKVSNAMELDIELGRLLSGIADQAALILERLKMGEAAEQTRLQAEREKLRAMLLSSVSHDLKTPLASVIGSLSVYQSMGVRLPEEHRTTLIRTALDEAQRLDSFITNILDMTRIESGQINLKKEWVQPSLLVSEITRRLRDRLRSHPIEIAPAPEGLEVMMDHMMTGQVIQNLLDNAAKYTAAGTRIVVSWQGSPERGFSLTVRDCGGGIPEEQLEKVFDKYARIKRQDSQVAGTGLGLAIARAVVQAQGGNIVAANHPQGGAMFTVTLPQCRKTDETKVA